MMATQAAASNRQRLVSRLIEARVETDALFGMVRPEAMYDRPIPERHRIVFYVGHLEAFDWNLLSGACGLASFRPDLDRLFAFGIDPVGGGLPADRPEDWPRIQDVNEYRDRVRQALDRTLDTAPLPEDGEGSFGQLLNIAIEHRLMHAETLAYMFHQMPFERKQGVVAPRKFQSSLLYASARAGSRGPHDARTAPRFGVVRLGQRVRGSQRRCPGICDRQIQGHERPVSRVPRGWRLRRARTLGARPTGSGRPRRESHIRCSG